MGTLLTTPTHHLMLDRAFLIPEDREVASNWASEHITSNEAYRWILGKYVEADNPNNNNQMWELGDLRDAQSTIAHAPLNVLHRPHHIVGNYVASEIVYPAHAEAQESGTRPFVEALAAFWKYYFPSELATIEEAHNDGSLFYSMECVAETITFVTPEGAEREFDFVGPKSQEYCGWDDAANVRRLNRPHFLGGALIIPPARPGWSGAEVKELSQLLDRHPEEAQMVYAMFEDQASHLSAKEWETMMLSVMASAKSETL